MSDAVVIAHPGRQHVYETVLAAQEAGLLRTFMTGVYVRRSHAARIDGVLRRVRVLRAVANGALHRSHPLIDPRRVSAFPAHHLAARLTWSLPGGSEVERWADRCCDRSIARAVERLEPAPQIVHSFEGGALATLGAARRVGAVTILDVPNAHEEATRALAGCRVRRSRRLTDRVLAERAAADYLFAPSPFVKSCLVAAGVDPGRIVLIPYGVDVERFTPAPPRDDDTFRVLFVGQVGLRKGVRELLEAWRRLALPRAELVLVGAADTDGRALLREHSGRCVWVDQVPRHEVDGWFWQSDVFAFPSLAEGSALVTYEAMASGLPIVTTPSSGSVARDGLDGFVVPPRDVDALVERLRYLHEHPGERRAMGGRARDLMAAHYTWHHYRERVAGAYREILGARA